jgi:hypothetical protein
MSDEIEKIKQEKIALYEKVKSLQHLEDEHKKINGKLRLTISNLSDQIEKLLKDQDTLNDQHTIELLEKDSEIIRLKQKIVGKEIKNVK